MRRRRRGEDEEKRRGEEKATDTKSNDPHLAGGEKIARGPWVWGWTCEFNVTDPFQAESAIAFQNWAAPFSTTIALTDLVHMRSGAWAQELNHPMLVSNFQAQT